jgi:extradiol dioxygenase family protein
MNDNLRPFHLAFPVNDIEETILWYTKNLFCKVGRYDLKWVDFNFFGHQISAHLPSNDNKSFSNTVDDHKVPVRHFGIILTEEQWDKLADNLKGNNIEFIIKPYTRFKGEAGEQSTMFIKDPSGNALEFKAFKNDEMIFEN